MQRKFLKAARLLLFTSWTLKVEFLPAVVLLVIDYDVQLWRLQFLWVMMVE